MSTVKTNFRKYFWNEKDSDLYDHLKADGTPGLQKRPNSIFAVTVPLKDNPLISRDDSGKVFDSFLASGLLALHGVRTLSPSDKEYRPTHDETGQNHDLSYHNGDVWPWLSGHVAEAAIFLDRLDVARQLLQNSVLRILTTDTLGSIEEIMDGTLPPGSDQVLGTSRGAMSQAWSVSEFIRAVHQGWFGISPNFAQARELELALVLPEYIQHARINTPLGEGTGTLQYDVSDTTKKITLEYTDMRRPFQVTLKLHRVPSQTNLSTITLPGRLVKHWVFDEESGWYRCTFSIDVTSPAKNSVTMSVSLDN
jgi:glycogen debranching enzyme